MGTRGVIGFVIDDQEKIAYQQYDSYPGGVGLRTLNWLRGGFGLSPAARNLKVVSDDGPAPTKAEITRLERFADIGVSTGKLTEWYVLLRKTQGDLGAILESGYVRDASNFVKDSLFCEWGYIVDLDAGMFDVYKGFQTSPPTDGRWVGGESDRGYFPIQRIASYPLDELPTDEEFLALEREDDDEEVNA